MRNYEFTKNAELIRMWRNSKEPKFTVWLTKMEEKCGFCEVSCGNPWCPAKEFPTKKENQDE